MTLQEAHARFALMIDDGQEFAGVISDLPEAPVLATGLAACSGWLADATTDSDLVEAIEYAWLLFEQGLLSDVTWGDAINEVFAAVESQVLNGIKQEHAN